MAGPDVRAGGGYLWTSQARWSRSTISSELKLGT